MMKKWEIIIVVWAIVMSGAAIYLYFQPPRTITLHNYTEVPVEKVVTKIKRVTVPGPERIVVIEKESLEEQLGLHLFDSQEMIADAEIPASDHNTSVVTIIDTETGEAKTLAKEKPLPLLGFENVLTAGVRYGPSTDRGQEGQIYSKWQFLRVGRVHLGTYGEVSSEPEAKIMAEIESRWDFRK